MVAREKRAKAVGVSISYVNGGPAMASHLGTLRQLLPARTKLVIGGAGAPASAVKDALVLQTLDETDGWARRMAGHGI